MNYYKFRKTKKIEGGDEILIEYEISSRKHPLTGKTIIYFELLDICKEGISYYIKAVDMNHPERRIEWDKLE